MNNLLVEVLRNPDRVQTLSLADWDDLIPLARSSKLLATLHRLLERESLLDEVPEKPRVHLYSNLVTHERQVASLAWEIRWLLKAVADLDVPLVLLKGGAYIQADIPASRGRLITDIDLMVPRDRIRAVETALNSAGWEGGYADEYDERYYREWMHEIPPMGHVQRGSTIDLHHTIVPPTTSPGTDAGKLFEALREIETGLYVLSPVDTVIHSATHLFHEGEFHNGFRDVFDLHCLLSGFAESEAEFWSELVPRARELDLLQPVFYALRYARAIFNTSIPEQVLAESRRGYRGKGMIPIMDFLFLRALAPDHYSCDRLFTTTAKFILYVRSHYLRMPLRLLIPHLLRKAWKRRFGDSKSLPGQETANTADEA